MYIVTFPKKRIEAFEAAVREILRKELDEERLVGKGARDAIVSTTWELVKEEAEEQLFILRCVSSIASTIPCVMLFSNKCSIW
jgi:hypothetical protein